MEYESRCLVFVTSAGVLGAPRRPGVCGMLPNSTAAHGVSKRMAGVRAGVRACAAAASSSYATSEAAGGAASSLFFLRDK